MLDAEDRGGAAERVAAVVRVEAAALGALGDRLGSEMRPAVEAALGMLLECAGAGRHVVVTGIGKSGLIGRKIAATLRSTGTAAHFLHPAEAIHGDLGMLGRGDVALVLSYSGETEEVLRLLPALERVGVRVVSLCGCAGSTLGAASEVVLDVSVSEEACGLGLAPTASTTAMLALGDGLAMELSRERGFQAEDFAGLHPGGRLGRRLARVREVMHAGEALPAVGVETGMVEVIYEMSRKKLGMTTVVGDGVLRGIISDGDLRRLLEREGAGALERRAGEVMNEGPQTIGGGAYASEALLQMEERKITSLVVVEGGEVQGVVHLHDLWGTGS